MRVMQIGNFGASWSTENDLRRSLESMGHDVRQVQENTWTGVGDLDGVSLVVYTHTHGWGPEPGAVLAFLERCRAAKVPTVGIHLDLWRGLERARNIPTTPWFRCDYIFTADGGDPEFWRGHGVNHRWLPPAVLEASCYLAEPDRALHPHDIVFVAARAYHSEYGFRAQLQEWLPKTYGDRFRHYEHGWTKDPAGDPHIESNKMRGHNLNVLYASAKVVIGDSCFAGTLPNYWSDRLPETLGRGGLLVFPDIEGLPWDTPMRTFMPANLDSLARAVEHVLSEPADVLLAQRHAAVAWARAGQTYRHRLESVFSMLRADGVLA